MELETLNNVITGNQLTTNFAAEWSRNGRIFIVTDLSVIVLHFCPTATNTENLFSFTKSEVCVGDYFIANHTGVVVDDIIMHLPKAKLYHSILNFNLTPNFSTVNAVTSRPIFATWLPIAEVINPTLAILTNTGNVEIVTQARMKWHCLVNITQCYVEHLKSTMWKEVITYQNHENKFEIHKKRVNEAIATAVACSEIFIGLDKKNYCYIIVGFANGIVTVWKYNYTETNITSASKPILIFSCETDLNIITSLHWYSSNKNVNLDWIIIGDIDGVIKCLLVINNKPDEFKTEKLLDIWKHKDIRVSHIISLAFDDSACFLILKGSYIILALVSNNKKVECVKFINIGHLNISGIQPMESGSFMISTITGAIKLLKIQKNNNDLAYVVSPVSNDIKWDYHACHAVIKSPDGLIWGMVMHPCKMVDHLILRNSVQITFCISTKLDPGKYLKSKSTDGLQNFWECIEIMRCLSARNNTLPCSWFPENTNYDELPLCELRILMWISLMCETMLQKRSKCRKQKNTLISYSDLRKIVEFKHRLHRISYILDSYDRRKSLNSFNSNSIHILFEEVTTCHTESWFKENIDRVLSTELDLIIRRVLELPTFEVPKCRWCGDNLTNKVCSANHPDQRCCITGVQLAGIPKWECELCGLAAAEEVEDENIFCPYCDKPMVLNLDFFTV